MLVYRVEHKSNGIGPYRSGLLPKEALPLCEMLHDAHNWDTAESFPAIGSDSNFTFKLGVHYCGFASLHKLLTWFNGFTTKFSEYGFEIVEYETNTPKFTISKKQIFFVKRNAKRVRTIDFVA